MVCCGNVVCEVWCGVDARNIIFLDVYKQLKSYIKYIKDSHNLLTFFTSISFNTPFKTIFDVEDYSSNNLVRFANLI